MILNQEATSATISGEIQTNKVGIDVDNINFITNLLTSNLYSLPIESFLRETVANAWDSQVEAGNTDTPILIKISNMDDEDISISVRDYGTGLSPERFNAIYRNIGSSTKRESNAYIGALGIGRFSCLAVSDTVSIKSYYEGKCYSYLMYKDGDSLNIDLLNTTDTTYKNGVDVQVTIRRGIYKEKNIRNGLAALAYFEQLYVDSDVPWLNNFVERFNKRTIHEFNHFKVCSLNELRGLHFLMGSVLYACHDYDYVEFTNNPNIAVTCNIGEVDITPNREDLRYSDKTKKTLTERIKNVNAEIYDIAKQVRTQDFKTVEAWADIINQQDFELTLWSFPSIDSYGQETENNIIVHITREQLQDNNISDECTIRGQKVPNDLYKVYQYVMSQNVSGIVAYTFSNGVFHIKTNVRLGTLIEHEKNYKKVFIHEYYKQKTKQYYKECIWNLGEIYTYFIKEDELLSCYKYSLRSFAKVYYSRFKCIDKDSLRLIRADIFEAFDNISSFDNQDVPKEWLKEEAETKQKTTRRKVVVHTLARSKNTSFGITTNTEKDLFDLLLSKTTIVYGELNSEDLRFMFKVFSTVGMLYHYTFIEVSKSNIHLLQAYKKFIPIERFMSEYNKSLSKLFTGLYIANLPEYKLFRDIYSFKEYSDTVEKIAHLVRCSNNVRDLYEAEQKDLKELYEYYVSKGWLDYNLINATTDKNYIQLSEFAKDTHICGALSTAEEIALSYFIYKNNIRIGNINRISAYKILKEYLKEYHYD